MTLLYYDPLFLAHETGNHPERKARLSRTMGVLVERGLLERTTRPAWQAATIDEVARVHDRGYLDMVRRFAEQGGGRIEADTVVSPRSFDAALLAAGAACDAVDRVAQGDDRSALCLVRPPGHHALAGGAMGFCLVGNVAVAARRAIGALGFDRVLIVDWDVHHGNGTQDIFYEDGQVAFFSAHRWPFYPGTGDETETGAGPGLGATRNLPVTYGTPREEYLSRFERELVDFAARAKPQLVIVSAGFDAHRLDPIGSLDLETEDFALLTKMVQAVADQHCRGKLVSVLEGGYDLDALADSVAVHLETLLGVAF